MPPKELKYYSGVLARGVPDGEADPLVESQFVSFQERLDGSVFKVLKYV